MARRIAMQPIPEPPEGTRPVLTHQGEGTVIFRGVDKHAPLTFVCGFCSAALAESIHSGQITSIVLKCNGCGTFNETDT